MLIAKIQVDGTHITRLHCDDIPKGIIGAQVEIEYTDRVWDGLNKTVVFYGGGVCKDVVTNDNVVTIPVEVVQQVGVILSIGVFGTDSDENIAIPTIRADLGYVRAAADPSGDESTDPSLPVWAQLNDRIVRLEDEGVPGGSGEPGEDGESAYEIAVRLGFEGSESEWLESLKGEDGKDGTSVTIESVLLEEGSGGSNVVTFSDGTELKVQNGKNGTDGRPAMHSWNGTVLTIYSATGGTSADLKGETGEPGAPGESGVYVGTETPNNNANVWINPEGEASTEGVYELIDTMTLNEESAKVVLDREPDGTPYNFKAMMIRAIFPICSYTGNISVDYWIGSYTKTIRAYFLTPYNVNYKRYGLTKVSVENGYYFGGWITCVNGPGDYAQYYENPYSQGAYGLEDGNLLRVEMQHATGIPEGTVFEIWGVRA